MQSQLRIYKIRSGQMANWLKFFSDKVVPMHRKFGIPARIAWIDELESEFIWVRDFSDNEPIEVQEQHYVTSDERRRVIGDESKSYIESMTVKVVRLAYERA